MAISVAVVGGACIFLRDQSRESPGAQESIRETDQASPKIASRRLNEDPSGSDVELGPSANKKAAYLELLGKAESGDYSALLEVQGIWAICLEHSPSNSTLPLEERPIAGEVPDEIRQTAGWKSAYAAQASWCGEYTELDDRVDALLATKTKLMRDHAARGDRVAMLYELVASEGKVSANASLIAIDLLRAGTEGGATSRMVHMLLTSEHPRVLELDARHLVNATPDQVTQVKRGIMMLYGCESGRPCGPRGQYQQELCVLRGWCETGLSIPAFMARYELTPEQVRVARAYTRDLNRLLSRN